MQTEISFGANANRTFKLERAILVYGDGQSFAASSHEIGNYYGRPVVKPGQPITVAALEQLMQSLGRESGAAFIPEQVVSLGLGRLAWWCPAGRRRIWFKPDRDDKELKSVSGKFVHHPPLLFVAGARGGEGLSAFALVANERPQADTRLWRAPYWNLDEQGGMCRGNLKLPIATPESIAAFEAAFFNSNFSHHTSGQLLTHHPGGHKGLWQALSARKTAPDAKFWIANLVRTEFTLAKLIKNQ